MRLKQAGDTIVEVLIAISVISLVLVGAYISTNQNVAVTEDAQERSQATKLVETQIEYLRTAGIDGSGVSKAVGTCYTTEGVKTYDDSPPTGVNPCIVSSSGESGYAGEPAYTLSINQSDTDTYTVQANWDSLTSSGSNNVTMYYQP